ncbi:hypothetical protein ACWCO0_09650 [Streptomyces tubercidicus]
MPKSDVDKSRPTGVVDAAELQLEDIQHEGDQALHARGVAYAKEYVRARDVAKTMIKNLAVVQFAIRMQHGDPKAEQYATKQAIKAVYDAAQIPDADQRDRLANSVRWHVGNLQRRYLTPRELKKLDLDEASPLERMQDARETNRVLLVGARAAAENAASASTGKKSSKEAKSVALPDDEGTLVDTRVVANQLRLTDAARNIMERLDMDFIASDLTAGQRARMDADLEAMQKRIADLRRKTRKRPAKS